MWLDVVAKSLGILAFGGLKPQTPTSTQRQSHPFYLVGEQLDSMKIEVYGHDGRTVMKTYMLKNLLVSKWEVSSLQAQGNEALIDTFTLAYGELHVLS